MEVFTEDYIWKDKQHQEHFKWNSKIISLFIPKKTVSLQFLLHFYQNLQCVCIRS